MTAARHGGFFGDIVPIQQWILTLNPTDARFNDNENRQTVVFMRC